MLNDELLKIAKAHEEDIENIENIEEFLDSVLEIKRTQSLVNGKWETTEYELLLTFGGPNVWLKTSGYLEISWASPTMTYPLSEKAKQKLKEIENYLDEIFGN